MMKKTNDSHKKHISLFLVLTLIVSIFFSACGVRSNVDVQNAAEVKKDAKKYETAAAKLQNTGLNEDGSYTVTEDLIVAIENEEFQSPKNIIYMIGDGMGPNIIEVSERYYADDLYNDTLAMNYLPLRAFQNTYSASNQVTDSAAGATALATGYKTTNGVVGKDEGGVKNYKNVLELASEKGKSTGIVATKAVTDATPAGFTAHVSSRTQQNHIALQQLEKLAAGSLDLVMGGGSSYYESDSNKDMFDYAKTAGMTYFTQWENKTEAKLPFVGLFASEHMDTTDAELPTLAEMTDLALKHLSEDEDGFFLMVEGSQIDSRGHANDLQQEAHELYHFDQAIAIAMRYVALNPDTVLIITADHETGGLLLPEEQQKGKLKGKYATGEHTFTQVPVYALGYDTENLEAIKDNTEIPKFIASLMGEDDFGQEDIFNVYDILDGDQKDHRKVMLKQNDNVSKGKNYVKIVFDDKNSEIVIPIEQLNADLDNVKSARTLSLVLKNRGEENVTAPVIKYTTDDGQNGSLYDLTISIEPGETKQITYVLNESFWASYACASLNELILFYNYTSDKNLELYDVYITEQLIVNE